MAINYNKSCCLRICPCAEVVCNSLMCFVRCAYCVGQWSSISRKIHNRITIFQMLTEPCKTLLLLSCQCNI